MIDKLTEAANEWHNRKIGRTYPDGKFDIAKRWWPSIGEEKLCCRNIRTPSRAFPFSLLRHCRTVLHIAHLYYVDPDELRRRIKELEPTWKLEEKLDGH
jgi:hypothetical protein